MRSRYVVLLMAGAALVLAACDQRPTAPTEPTRAVTLKPKAEGCGPLESGWIVRSGNDSIWCAPSLRAAIRSQR